MIVFGGFIQHIVWLVALTTSLGGIGVAIAVFAFGLPVALAIARVLGAFAALIAFLRTPVGQAAAVVVMVVAAFVAGDVHRLRLDQAQWCAQQASAEQRAAELERFAAAEADARIADVEARAKDLQQKVAEYEKTIAERKSVACLASPEDSRGLQRIEPSAAARQRPR